MPDLKAFHRRQTETHSLWTEVVAFRSLILGDEILVVECADQFLYRGWAVAVFTADLTDAEPFGVIDDISQ